MTYLICGLIIGSVMGLTGAGGALIAIPLFLQFLGMSLKEASVLSLVAVVIASLSNFLNQKKFTHYKLAVLLIASATVGSLVSSPFKKAMPEMVVAFLLSVVSIYALFSVWYPPKEKEIASTVPSLLFTLFIGFLLGILTTFTGLGGGVLMMPVLLSFYHFNQEKAVATSLLAVGLSSLASLVIQFFGGAKVPLDLNLALLLSGIILSSVILKLVTAKLSSKMMVNTRKVVFTIVVMIALIKIF